jgi:peptidoglycan/LPS O-acetylase OafA/YrhL
MPSKDANPSLGYIPELDGLRAIAILLVLVHHAGVNAIAGGQIGVDIFFVLSGFLITSLLLRERERFGRVDLKNFYIRRALRLMPALMLLLACVAALAVVTKSGAELRRTLESIGIALLYLSDIALSFGWAKMGSLEHTWSLSIEEHFYLLFPPVLVLLLSKGVSKRVIGMMLGGLIILISFHRMAMWAPDSTAVARVFYGFDTHSDGLLLGCLAAVLANSPLLRELPRWLHWTAWAFLTFGVVQLHWDSRAYAYLLPAINLSTAIIIVGVLRSKPRWLRAHTLTWIGQISYGLYLWHNLIFIVIRERVTDSAAVILVGGGLVSIAVAAASFYMIEKPCLRLKSRFQRPSIIERDQPALPIADEQPSPAHI